MKPTADTKSAAPACLARSVAEAFTEDPTLEAVTLNKQKNTISVASLGRTDEASLRARIGETVARAEAAGAEHRCGLLDGSTDCAKCEIGLTERERKNITIQHTGEVTTIARVTCPTAPRFWRWRDIPWPKVVPRTLEIEDEEKHIHEWKQQLVAAGLCGALGVLAYNLPAGPLAIGAYALSFLAGGWFTAEEVWERLRERILDVHFLMLAVAVGSASVGAWAEGATLLFLFSLSGALEHYAMGRTQREIRSLFKNAPKVATLLDAGGHERAVPVESLAAGMKLLIKPGEQFPVDAEITRGTTAADESNLTGEATPVAKAVGDGLLAGTINLWGVVEAVVTRPASQSALQKIIHLIKEAQHLKAPAQRFTDKFSTGYTYLILGLSLGMFFFWWLVQGRAPFVSGDAGPSAFYRSMTLLVVASPCALVLSIPSAVLAAIAWGARRGILFRGGAAVEKLAEVTVVALDKTGTLTTGELQVERVESFPPGRETEVAALAFSLERLSTHPLARAITRHGKQAGLQPLPLEHFESVTGLGLRAQTGTGAVALGRREWLADGPHRPAIAQVPAPEPGRSEVWVTGESLVGRLLLRDEVRPQAREVIASLRRLGLRSIVLTGDRHSAAEHLREQVTVDEIRAELKPEQKVAAIQELSRDGVRVAMVGDGVNDAPSLAAAHVGVAMGARGSDAALEQAEVVLMHDRLETFLTAFLLSQRARRIIRQNLVISLGTVVVLVTFALFGGIPLTVGVVGHEGSTVIVVLNSLRLLLNASAPAATPRPSAPAPGPAPTGTT